MITVLLEPGRAKPSKGALVAVAAMMGYTLCASIIAGAVSPGAGLGVIATGLFAATVADFALWREMVSNDVETVEAVANESVPALPAPSPMPVASAMPEAVPA
jgi:hypothetical protein